MVEMKRDEWESARDAFKEINTHPKWLSRLERAKAGYHYGETLEKMNDPGAAIVAFMNVWNVHGNIETTTAEAFEKWLDLGLKDSQNLKDDEGNPATPSGIREKKIEYYVFLKTKLYQWQKWDFEKPENEALRRLQVRLPQLRTELGITTEEETAIDAKLGINQPEK